MCSYSFLLHQSITFAVMYKLVCSDIDGTLLNKDRELSSATIKAVNALSIPFVLISSRMPEALTHLQKELNIESSPLICYNGALIKQGNTFSHSIEIPIECAEYIFQLNHRKSFHISLYQHNDWYVEEMDYWAKREARNTKTSPTLASLEEVIGNCKKQQNSMHKIMCMGESSQIEELYHNLQAKYHNELHLYRSKPTYLEISSKKTSKLRAIEKLLPSYQASLSEVMAFGDNYNDIEMLQSVGKGIAVANAQPEVLDIASETTKSNKEDGVAFSLNKYFLT